MANAGVIAANIHWKIQNVSSGTAMVGCANTCMRAIFSKLPMNFPPVFENVSEYPHNHHYQINSFRN
jgi:hypothetical protein